MLRLPSSFSFPSVSLGTDTTPVAFSYRNGGKQLSPQSQVALFTRSTNSRVFNVETVGSPMFPRFPILPLIWSPTPAGPQQLATSTLLRCCPHQVKSKDSSKYKLLSRLNTYLQQSLSTLHASISTDYARLASGGGLALPDRIGYLQGI